MKTQPSSLVPLVPALFAASCGPSVPLPPGATLPGPDAELVVEPGPVDAAAPVVRVRATFGAPRASVAAHLVTGLVAPSQVGALASGDVSQALAERSVPLTVFGVGAEWTLAPAVPLASGPHTLVVEESGEELVFDVAPSNPWSLLARAWPPEGLGGRGFALLCAGEPLPPFEALEISLEGSGDEGVVERGALPGGAVARCARWRSKATGIGSVGVFPTHVDLGVRTFFFDPAPLVTEALAPPGPVMACAADAVPFGPGCARVFDDRIEVAPPSDRVLWVVAAAGAEIVVETQGEPFVVAPLPSLSSVAVELGWARVGSAFETESLLVETKAPAAHFVVNEVVANPLGPEPESEWVELVNAGDVTIALEDWKLRDGGGDQDLPGVDVKPGAYVVLVHAGAPLPEGLHPLAVVVPMETIGKNGLSNAGEPVSLVGPGGVVASTLPALPKPKEGMSVARKELDAPDGAASSFGVATPTPGGPNGGWE